MSAGDTAPVFRSSRRVPELLGSLSPGLQKCDPSECFSGCRLPIGEGRQDHGLQIRLREPTGRPFKLVPDGLGGAVLAPVDTAKIACTRAHRYQSVLASPHYLRNL
jgi:hypothetical protein